MISGIVTELICINVFYKSYLGIASITLSVYMVINSISTSHTVYPWPYSGPTCVTGWMCLRALEVGCSLGKFYCVGILTSSYGMYIDLMANISKGTVE